MIWLGTFFMAIFLGLTGMGWWWLPLMLVCAFVDVGWLRPERDRARARRRRY